MTKGCEKTLLVQAEFDGELDAAESASLKAHRERCAVCQETWQTLAASSAAIQGATRHTASAALRQRLEQRLPRATVAALSRRVAWTRMGGSFALGAALAASLAMALLPSSSDPLVAAVVDDHVRSLQPGHLEDVVSTDQHTVKPWFDGRLDFAPPVKDLKDVGYPLLGGRLDYLGGHAVAALAYQHGKHPINLFIWPERGTAAPSLSTSRNGYNVIHWQDGGMSFWAVSDLERDELQIFVEDWQRAG